MFIKLAECSKKIRTINNFSKNRNFFVSNSSKISFPVELRYFTERNAGKVSILRLHLRVFWLEDHNWVIQKDVEWLGRVDESLPLISYSLKFFSASTRTVGTIFNKGKQGLKWFKFRDLVPEKWFLKWKLEFWFAFH